jgi:hypothetical protein
VSVDLTGPRATLEARLVDACAITRDAEREGDDVLDPDTLVLARPSGDTTTIYEGPCLIGPILTEQVVVVGAREITRRRYRARLPHTAPAPQVGDVLTVTAAEYDPELVDASMVVTDVPLRTYQVSRVIFLAQDLGERA